MLNDFTPGEAITIITFASPVLVWLTTWLYQYALEHQPTARAKRIRSIVADVVLGVEQLGYTYSATNSQKKQKAMSWVLQIAHSYHLPISDAEIEALVEAAVARLPATWERDPHSQVARDNWIRDTAPPPAASTSPPANNSPASAPNMPAYASPRAKQPGNPFQQ